MSYSPRKEVYAPKNLKGKRKSNYEGFKALDKMLEGVDSGRLKPAREPIRDILCPMCSTRKRSWIFCRSEILGVRNKDLPFRIYAGLGDEWWNVPKGLIVCWECAPQFGVHPHRDARKRAG